MTKKLELSGKRFGKLVAIEPVGNANSGGILWLCQCDCGNKVAIRASYLVRGHTKSCGCLRAEACKETHTKHGLEKERLYGIWADMHNRCNNPNAVGFHRYGGRGISVCDAWSSCAEFKEWALSHGYRDDLTIDRINNDGNYEPSNCRWATVKEQANNRRSNVIITLNGKTQTMKQWASEVGIPYEVVWARMQKLGWTAERALTEPVKKRRWKA